MRTVLHSAWDAVTATPSPGAPALFPGRGPDLVLFPEHDPVDLVLFPAHDPVDPVDLVLFTAHDPCLPALQVTALGALIFIICKVRSQLPLLLPALLPLLLPALLPTLLPNLLPLLLLPLLIPALLPAS